MTTGRRHIALLCTLDTKSEHAAFIKDAIERRGHAVLLIDIGVLGGSVLMPAITRQQIATAGGGNIDALATARDRGAALAVMSAGAASVAVTLHAQGQLDGIIGLGGGSGTAIATMAMRALPVGVPKVMISTMASTVKAASYVGTSDIAMFNTITDIVGMNPILRGVLAQGAGAICGMVEADAGIDRSRSDKSRPTVAITAFGSTSAAVTRAHELLTTAGCETLIFHANGTGGRSMEELIAQGAIDAVLDLTTTELADELCGGFLSAGPDRLEAAGARGIPQVVLPGALDMVNFTTPDTVPSRYAGRLLAVHSPNTTLMRTTAEESGTLGRWVGEKLARARRPAVLMLPLGGFSMYDHAGGVFFAPESNATFMTEATRALGDRGEIVRLDVHINDPICAETAVARLLAMLNENKQTPA